MSKKERERQVLLGLVDFFIKTGKPVGSNTLKSAGFDELSSATIRNYFANLEQEGLLQQQHSSGGRLPTEAAFRFYANSILDDLQNNGFPKPPPIHDEPPQHSDTTRAIATYLQRVADSLSTQTGCAAFLSAPRFDRDFIVDIKLVPIDSDRCLCVIITDFGLIQTELLHAPHKLSTFSAKRIESYFQARLSGTTSPHILEAEEEKIAQLFYNEIIVRHLVSYSNFSSEYLYSTGFAQLLNSPEFHDVKVMASSLALFEDQQSLRHLIQHSCRHGNIKIWIGGDLAEIGCPGSQCTVLALPYRIHNQIVGAIGLLGPMRMPYREHIALLKSAAEQLSDNLTRTVYKFKITFRQPKHGPIPLEGGSAQKLLPGAPKMLLEDQRTAKAVKKKS